MPNSCKTKIKTELNFLVWFRYITNSWFLFGSVQFSLVWMIYQIMSTRRVDHYSIIVCFLLAFLLVPLLGVTVLPLLITLTCYCHCLLLFLLSSNPHSLFSSWIVYSCTNVHKKSRKLTLNLSLFCLINILDTRNSRSFLYLLTNILLS